MIENDKNNMFCIDGFCDAFDCTTEGDDGLTNSERSELARSYREKAMKPLSKEEKAARMAWVSRHIQARKGQSYSPEG